MFQQQFQAEETLVSDNSNNELLIINLATVPAERNTIFPPAQSRQPLVAGRPRLFKFLQK
jgi:hypothetical protein